MVFNIIKNDQIHKQILHKFSLFSKKLMNLSPIPAKKNLKLDEDFFSIDDRDSSFHSYDGKKAHSVLDMKELLEFEEEEERKTGIKPVLLKVPFPKELNVNFMEKRRLSRAVETNIVQEMELDSVLDKSANSKKSNNNSLQKIESSSSSQNNSESNNSSSQNKSSYSYSSSSSSISIENQEKVEIENIIK